MRKNNGSATAAPNEQDDNQMAWHCYLCGHSWQSHDKTNPDIPTKCMKCGRQDFRKPDKVCTHDRDCLRCKNKRERLLKVLEKLIDSEKRIKDGY